MPLAQLETVMGLRTRPFTSTRGGLLAQGGCGYPGQVLSMGLAFQHGGMRSDAMVI